MERFHYYLRIGCRVVGFGLFVCGYYYGFFRKEFAEAAYYMAFAVFMSLPHMISE